MTVEVGAARLCVTRQDSRLSLQGTPDLLAATDCHQFDTLPDGAHGIPGRRLRTAAMATYGLKRKEENAGGIIPMGRLNGNAGIVQVQLHALLLVGGEPFRED